MKTSHATLDAALQLVREMGILRPRDLKARGIPQRYAALLFQSGVIRRLGRGLYAAHENSMTAEHTLAMVGARAPQAIVCLLTALRFHELTTQQPTATWIAIAPKARPPHMPEFRLKVVRFSGASMSEGIEEHCIEGVHVRITSPEKTVIDCFRYRNKIGRDIAVEALRDAVEQRKVSISELVRLAHACRAVTVMRPYLELFL